MQRLIRDAPCSSGGICAFSGRVSVAVNHISAIYFISYSDRESGSKSSHYSCPRAPTNTGLVLGPWTSPQCSLLQLAFL